MSKHPRRRNLPAPDQPGVAARRSALRLLDAVLRRGETLEVALHAATQGLTDPSDRALAHAIAAETLRRLPDLDALIDGATEKRLPDDAKARMVLRMALAQALSLETPAHAAIATALPLVDGGPKKLVHGVFGTLLRGEVKLPEIATLPADAAERWTAQWGEDMAAAASQALAKRPPIDLSLRDATETADWAAKLGGMSLAPGHVRLPADHPPIPELPGFAEGAWWVQDIAASLPTRLIGAPPSPEATVLDLCAAPGGKTMQLLAAGWQVTAVDQSAKRLERLAQNLKRMGFSARTIAADLRKWEPEEPADAVLLDAPCSATGIFRRHPDVLHRIGARQISELAELQAELLERAWAWVKPGGRLVFATCSLERAEGEDRIEQFLASHSGQATISAAPEMLPAGIAPASEGWVRTLPNTLAGTLADSGGADGFFTACITRR